jgi:glutathione S-transferase
MPGFGKLVLHQMHVSGNCYKVRLLAHQLGVALTLKDYPLMDGKTRTPEFLAKNANGRVPLLEFADGRFLAESGAILFHLSEGTPLQLADHPWARAQMLQWMFFEQYSHEPYIAVARYWLSYAPKEELEKKRHLVPEWHAKGNAALGVMEQHLKSRDWFAGNYSIADIALYAYTHAAAEGGFDLAAYPAWRNRTMSAWMRPEPADKASRKLSDVAG